MVANRIKRVAAIILCFAIAIMTLSAGIFALDEDNTSETTIRCTCGEDAPENIAYHADSCPRKTYIILLVKGKSAKQIYASWDEYDEATRTDILNLVEVYYTTTYDELVALVKSGESKNETEVNGVKITAQGVPEGVTLKATAVTCRDYSEKVLDFVGNKKIVFAYDLTLEGESGEWQPSEGEEISVTVDASALGLENGERIGVLHEHGEKLDDLGTSTVAEGSLTFATDGFSTFYGYTVDFEFDGVWHSISGGSGIFLSELFVKLGINRDANDATNVVFSDPSLIEVQRRLSLDTINIHEEWYLQSLKAFDTAETLTITFSNGDEMVINVYDAITQTVVWNNNTATCGTGVGTSVLGYANQRVHLQGNNVLYVNGTLTINCQFYIPSGASLAIRATNGTATIIRNYEGLTDDAFYLDGGTLDIRPYDNDQPGQANDNKGQIILDGNITYTVTDDATMKTQKNLSHNISDKSFNGSAIFINGGKLRMHRVKFQNFLTLHTTTGDHASVIHSYSKDEAAKNDSNYATINMRDCDITHCGVTGTNSVLLFNDAKVSMVNCRITDCYSGELTYAGVLKGSGSFFCQLTMTGCTMSECYSSGWGGAILWAASNTAGSETSKATIDNCTFTNNTAKWLGGAISNEAIMTVTNTTITNNRAQSGGGIASFPFTLTKDTDSNAVGLTLGSGNVITKNTAVATGDFVEDITNQKKYPAGGAGIWVFLNKEKWSGYLDIGSGNDITYNTSNYKGGGIAIATQAVADTKLTISGATLHDNTAVYGGGIASENSNVTLTDGTVSNNTATKFGGGIYLDQGTCIVSGSGKVNQNDAANGGGLYINDGALNVTGGVIISNAAHGNFTGATAQSSEQGVGGGIYVKKGSFTLSGSSSGLHSNTASVAADDAYATGGVTTLTLPDVKKMNLTGWSGTAAPTGWFADYMANDIQYPLSILGQANPGRYSFYDPNKLEVEPTTLAANKTAYYCLTIGTPHPGNGNVTITKTLAEVAKQDEVFIFEITGTTRKPEAPYTIQVTIVVPKGKTKAEVLIEGVPDGTYTITEIGDWSWRFSQTECEIYAKNDRVRIDGNTFTLGAEHPNWEADFTNKRTEKKWLSGDCYCNNIWRKDEDEESI